MKAYKYKLYKDEDNKHLDQLIDLNGKLYNLCLNLHRRYYKLFKKFLNIYQLQKHLTKIKKQNKYSWISKLPSQSIQEVTERLDKGYKLFFNNKKNKIKVGLPSFKSCKKYKSFTLKTAGFKLLEGNEVLIQKRKYRYFKSQDIKGNIKRISISRNVSLKEYYLIVITDFEDRRMINYTGKSVGFDFGLKNFLIGSNNEKIESPLYLFVNLRKLRRLSRNFSKKTKGSKNWYKAKIELARLHKKITNQRQDFLYQLASKLLKTYDYMFFENLDLKKLQRMFGRKISDLSFGSFLDILSYKAEKCNKVVKFIDRYFPSSKTCHICGFVNEDLKLSDREWTCSACSTHHDRDFNASCNIYTAGTSAVARGV